MMNDVELDRILGSWLSAGPERAPQADVQAAFAQVATTGQRRRRLVIAIPVVQAPDRRWWLAAALLALLLALAIGFGSGAIRLHAERNPLAVDAPEPPRPVLTSPPAVTVALRPIHIEDWAVELSIPKGWWDIGDRIVEFRHFSGTSPEGHLSVGHESPFWTSVCSPECEWIEVPGTIPYDATAQIEALKSSVATIVGSETWTDLPAGVLPQVEHGAMLDTIDTAKDGRSWRRIHIVGLRERNLVAIAWSQPAEAFDRALLDQILAGIHLLPAPVYSDGDLVRSAAEGAFTMPVPGLWQDLDQPALDGQPLSGVYRFGQGRVVVSFGSPSGEMPWCDPDCHVAAGVTDLDTLEATIRARQTLDPTTPTTLGGEAARSLGATTPVERRYVLAMHQGRPVVAMVDVGEWVVAPGTLDQMIAGFEFVDPAPVPGDQVFRTAGERVELHLSDGWGRSALDDKVFYFGKQRMTVRIGRADGRITTCSDPAGPWELCRVVKATTLDELVAAVQPAPIADHGVGPPTGRVESISLDGEPAMMTRIQAYEYPAHGGQEVVYLAAIHDGRPVLIRLWTSANNVVDLDSVIAGVRFVD